ATLYVANRSHLAWPMLEALVGLRSGLLGRIREVVAGWEVAPLHVSLFGSAARRDGGAESDIDMLIVRPDDVAEGDETWETQIDTLRDQVVAWTGNRCQAFDIGRARLREHLAAHDPLVENWLRDEVLLAGEPLRSLIDNLAVVARS
ncbi:MAG TPA: nucleotidyltransferase domain-containing protein, partial [Candidatus Limnocylindrales bacterium]|nr:nucleotidyltransferase domain-containing protein [Candidatus Limnocylindrales bacterium]